MAIQLEKTYDPKQIEDRLYSNWCEKGYFSPKADKNKKPFTIVIPPPNVTGKLHMGHALDESMQDVLVRFKRMQGYSALWVPGTDHAGIATQIKVEETLRKEEGLSRYDLGREQFIERVWDWKREYGNEIVNQIKKLGASCDWSRERFTMDENLSAAVKKFFVTLYNKGLIYKGLRITNRCPKCATALSDAEVEHKDKEGSFWHIKYYFKDSDEYIVIATTRPETLLGDTAVAVNPDDERYKHLVGKTLILPLVNREIPLIADEYVDASFGTGCVKITPCHDPNDFEVGQRHNLPHIFAIDDNAKITKIGGKYEGLDRFEARKAIVADLEAAGLLVKIENYTHSVGHCHRCGTVVEPLASEQWFVKMEPLAERAIDVVENGEVRFVPERFSKIYINWMTNIKDWCISRQLWWGHRIPAYYCKDCGETIVSETQVHECTKCHSHNIKQDEDVLDTWFSSALWPFSTLGWPNSTEDLEYFYPTSALVTGYDIIFFWVARMIFSALEMTDKKPFSDILIHGLVRDAQGRKMSKSLGNGINPLDIIDKYGADALRFALLSGNAPGNDMRFSDEKIESARNFSNKIWNAARFVLMNIDESTPYGLPEEKLLHIEDKWIISKYNSLVGEIVENLDKYEMGIALAKIYDFLWNVYCDWYVELIKPRLFDKESDDCKTAGQTAAYILGGMMKLLHPFMPFITEEIYLSLPHDAESIVIAKYPEFDTSLTYKKEEEIINDLTDAIRSIRNRRAELNIPPSKKATIFIVSNDDDTYNAQTAVYFEKLASASKVEFCDEYASDENSIHIAAHNAQIFVPLAEIVDTEKEIARLNAEKENWLKEIARFESKLSNEGFVAKAPAAVVEGERKKMILAQEKLQSVLDALKKYGK